MGWIAAIVLSWGNDCATFNPWGFAACRNVSNQNSSSAVMLWGGVWGLEGGFQGLRVVLQGLRVVLHGFEVAISCGVDCRNCAELG